MAALKIPGAAQINGTDIQQVSCETGTEAMAVLPAGQMFTAQSAAIWRPLVSEAMIEAGVAAMEFHGRTCTTEFVVEAVYIAMAEACLLDPPLSETADSCSLSEQVASSSTP